MVVLYYTSIPYLECAVEIIRALKKEVELHVVIEIAPETKTGPITEVKELTSGPVLRPLNALLNQMEVDFFQSYFEGTASTQFIVHEHKKTFSYATFKVGNDVVKFCKKIKPDIIHFDSITPRALGMLPYLFTKMAGKIAVSLHDPVSHSGEDDWRTRLTRSSFSRIAGVYFFYSEFARQQFESAYPRIGIRRRLLNMNPYSYYRNYISGVENRSRDYILFFGRISPYKGLENFLGAIPDVLTKFPNQKFLMAGRINNGYQPDLSILEKFPNNIQFINRYIPNRELVELISSAQFVVCPYKDATQSGVLMTSFACNTPVIASNVGAFPQYIREGWNGSLIEVNDAETLADKITGWLESGRYKDCSQNLKELNGHGNWLNNREILLDSYNSLVLPKARGKWVAEGLQQK
jgi:glycosyltransferase involved in cell wall biosynthesis